MNRTRFDVTVFGATSFVGKILCRYLLEQFGTQGALHWAVAGRSEAKLLALRETLGTGAASLATIVADADDEASLRSMCEGTRVVISTVGPYALYGEPLVKVCAEVGTDYCDLTGEVQWIRKMIQSHEAAARASGARIVHCCGFDSIPSDMGVYFLQREARRRFGQPCARVKMRVKAMRGGLSGGTAASMLNVMEEMTSDPSLRAELANPYSLCKDSTVQRPRQPGVGFAQYDPDFDGWVAPFIMGAINTRIVHRTNALSGNAYGQGFVYDEAVLTGRGLRGSMASTAIALAMGGFALAGLMKPTRWALQRFVLPAPGEGPSPRAQEHGFYDLRFFGEAAEGKSIRTKVTGDRDPGYGSTAKMLGQAGACLALDITKSAKPGGFWTPAMAFGDLLIDRLVAHSGVRFEVIEH